jgi:hypothetical protein
VIREEGMKEDTSYQKTAKKLPVIIGVTASQQVK